MISVRDVVVELGEERVLDGVSLDVHQGDFVGLVGPNGAGKTTLLRTINGALTPTQGTVEVSGKDIHSLSSRAASRLVATVPQTTEFSFDFSVREAVEMGRTPHRSRFGTWTATDEEAVDQALSRTAVENLANRPVSTVSGGERQRTLIARALAQTTPVMVLDEPTASLDINHQVRTLELVRTLVAEDKTALAAIHDLNLAAHYCDSLVLLANRRVLTAGSPQDVLTETNLREAFDTNAVVSRHPVTGAVYVTALPDAPVPSDAAAGRVHVVGGGGSAARVLYLLSAAGYTVTAGALNEGDTDTETARHLGIDTVTVPPYAGVDESARDAVADRVAAADAVVVTDIEVGEGNLANLDAAAAADTVVLVEERPFSERNFAGTAGEQAYERLRAQAQVVDTRGVVGAVQAALGQPNAGRAGDGNTLADGSNAASHSRPPFSHSSSSSSPSSPSPSSES